MRLLVRVPAGAGVLAAIAAAAVLLAFVAVARADEPVSDPAALPMVHATPANLQEAFENEANAKERYATFAGQAEAEGYPRVARLFRACAAAEQVHAERHVHAIAWCGGEARARLQRVVAGDTRQNLQTSLEFESWEATQLYPAMLAQARADRAPEAVRSLNFALAAERDHVRLLTEALRTLETRAAAAGFHVCPTCGHTVESIQFRKCVNCFTSARRFARVG